MTYIGSATNLDKLIGVDNASVYIIEPSSEYSSWDAPNNECNLGKRRYLSVQPDSILLLEENGEYIFSSIEFVENESRECKVADLIKLLRKKGYKCESLKVENQHSFSRPDWREFKKAKSAIVTESGMALFYHGWFDCWTYFGKVHYIKPLLFIDGNPCEYISFEPFLLKEYKDDIRNLIQKSLEEKHEISLKKLIELIKSCGYKDDDLQYLRISYFEKGE